ncbi:MAG: hypothetical protein LUD78_03670 [Clostridiales bacterium]|nr:hypothetical protein [Clostridiales bacterium]
MKTRILNICGVASLLCALALLLTGCASQNSANLYETDAYSVELESGWTVTEPENSPAAALTDADGQQVATLEARTVEDDQTIAMLVGAHCDVVSTEDIALEGEGATLTRVVSRWWLSAAQQEEGEEQPEDETHYFYWTDDNYVVELTLSEGVADSASFETLMKSVAVK